MTTQLRRIILGTSFASATLLGSKALRIAQGPPVGDDHPLGSKGLSPMDQAPEAPLSRQQRRYRARKGANDG